jgi:anti-sigma B factor antagonist
MLLLANRYGHSYSAYMREVHPRIDTFDSIYFVSPGCDELDAYAAPSFMNRMTEAIHDPNSQTIIADLSKTSFMDSLGLGVLVGGLKKCQEIKKTFYVDITGDDRGRLQKIFEITGTEELLHVITPREGIK